jgi:hypothetical protein
MPIELFGRFRFSIYDRATWSGHKEHFVIKSKKVISAESELADYEEIFAIQTKYVKSLGIAVLTLGGVIGKFAGLY